MTAELRKKWGFRRRQVHTTQYTTCSESQIYATGRVDSCLSSPYRESSWSICRAQNNWPDKSEGTIAGSSLSFTKVLSAFRQNSVFEACIKCCTENFIFARIGRTCYSSNIWRYKIFLYMTYNAGCILLRFAACHDSVGVASLLLIQGTTVWISVILFLETLSSSWQFPYFMVNSKHVITGPVQTKTVLANHSHWCQLLTLTAVLPGWWWWWQVFLDAFANLRNATISFDCLYGVTRFPINGFSWNLIWEYSSKICPGNSSLIEIWHE